MNYQNWKVEKDKNNIVWAYLDKHNESVNTINQAILNELEQILIQVEQEKPQGIIFASAKASGFIAGAEIDSFREFKTVEETHRFIAYGQSLFRRITRLPFPSVAMVKGFCLGGGLELALACTYIVADDGQDTRLGLPEILLGIHPGWGGCVKLPRKIGAFKALNLILTGATKNARDAYKLGFVDEVIPLRHLKTAAIYYVIQKPKHRHPTLMEKLSNNFIVRKIFAPILRRQIKAKVNPKHYPSPFKVINIWEKYGVSNEVYPVEAKSLSQLILDDTAKNLVRVFFLQERLKSLGKMQKFSGHHIHVIGAGVMGGDIAIACALSGYQVTVQDKDKKAIAQTLKRAKKLYEKILKQPRLVTAALDRLIGDPDGYGIAHADLFIEAVVEKLEVKRSIFKMLEEKAKNTAIFATNTSSIPLDEINQVLDNPKRLIGIHFFNPVDKMKLVEVVHSKVSDQTVMEEALNFVKTLNKLPLPVKSAPGFLVNRILLPYSLEAILMLEEGIDMNIIDRAAKRFGMPMGPIELADMAGLDVSLMIAIEVAPFFNVQIPEILRDKVARGHFGKKTGQGFYHYNRKGKPIRKSSVTVDESKLNEYTDRLIYAMLNESVKCLDEKIVADGDLVDAGMIFGIGFAPFRGGPIHYMQHVGFEKIRDRMLELQKAYGDRFRPAAGFNHLIKEHPKQNKEEMIHEVA